MEKIPETLLIILLTVGLVVAGCSFPGRKKKIKPFTSEVIHPDWSKAAVIYEVNLRQFTEEGTLDAFAEHLPRLKALGIGILWFMPIYPIGVVNRKGELGSYYSVKDYRDVNPEFGTLEDFSEIAAKAHELGMHVLLDWVPNHTSWDNPLTEEHPEWFMTDPLGKFIPPIGTDWTDVIQLDWSKKELWDYTIEALKFWMDLGADGFRVDHPHNTPVEFWEQARTDLSAIKPVLMLAEYEGGFYMEKGFDMDYSWELFHLMNRIAQGKNRVKAIHNYFDKELATYPDNVYRLMFLTNHDENSWLGTVDSLMGGAQMAFATLIFTARGVPLIYSGQEACLDKKLKFFERDPIGWDTCRLTGFYEILIRLKTDNRALWNGESGGPMVKVRTNRQNKVFSYYREKDGNRVLVFLNLTRRKVSFKPVVKGLEGEYTDYFTETKVDLQSKARLDLEEWGFKVLIR